MIFQILMLKRLGLKKDTKVKICFLMGQNLYKSIKIEGSV